MPTQDLTFVLKARNDAKRAVTEFARNMKNAGMSTEEIADEAAKAAKNTDRLGKEAKQVSDEFGKAEGQATRLNSTVGLIVKGIAGLAGTIGLGVLFQQAIGGALEFDRALAETGTLLDGNTTQIRQVADASRELAEVYGTSSTQQVQAFYQAISAGAGNVAQATELLDAANALAEGGVSDVTTAVDILTTTLNAYGASNISAIEASDSLFVAVKAGKTTVDELAAGLGAVIPFAQSAGVSFDELTAATAALTTQGISTNRAVTGLRAVFAAVLKPADAAKKLAKDLGIEFNSAAIESKGFAAFLEDVVEKTNGNKEALAVLFPQIEALAPIYALAGAGGQKFNQILEEQANKAGATAAAVEVINASLSDRFDDAIASIGQSLALIGETLLVVVVPAVELAAGALKLFAENLDLLGIAIGLLTVRSLPGLIGALASLASSLGITVSAAGLATGAITALSAALRLVPFAAVVLALTDLVRGFREAKEVQEDYADSIIQLTEAFDGFYNAGALLARDRTLENAEAFKSAADAAVIQAKATLEAAKAVLEARQQFSLYNVVTDTFNIKTRKAAEAVKEAEAALFEAEAAADAASVAVDSLGAEAAETAADMAGLAADIDAAKSALDRLTAGASSRGVKQAGQAARLQTLQASGNIQAAAVAQQVAEARAANAEAIANAPADVQPILRKALEREIAGIRETAKTAEQISKIEGEIRASQRSSSRGGGGGAQKTSAISETVNKLTEEFRVQAETVGLAGRALEEYNIRQELAQAAAKDGVALSEETVQAVLQQRDAYEQAAQSADTFANGARQGWEDFKNAAQTNAEFAASFVNNAFTGISNTISEFVKTGKADFKGLLADLLGQISQFLANRLIIDFLGLSGSLSEGIGGGIGQKGGTLDFIGGLLGSFGGGGGTSSLGGAVFPGLATGGPANAAQPYLVGEEGPELFVPSRNGRVIPNDMLGGGGTNVTFNITTPDADSFNRSRGQIEARMAAALDRANTRNN